MPLTQLSRAGASGFWRLGAKRGNLVVLLGVALASLSQWYLLLLVARGAGAEGVGTYSATLAVATPISVALRLGLRPTFLSAGTRWPLRSYYLLRVSGLALSASTLFVLAAVLPGVPLTLALAVATLKSCDGVLDLQEARLQYAGRMRLLGWITVANAVGTSVGATAAFALTGRLIAPVLASAASSTAAAIVAWWANRHVSYLVDEAGHSLRKILAAGIPITVSDFLSNLLVQMPIIALTTVRSPDLGRYAAAAYLVAVATILGSAIQIILITPMRRRREAHGDDSVRQYVATLSRRLLMLGAAVALAAVLLGSAVLTSVYGPEFGMGVLPLALLATSAVATTASMLRTTLLTVLNRYQALSLVMAISCGLSALVGAVMFAIRLDPVTAASGMIATGSIARFALLGAFARDHSKPTGGLNG